MSDHVSKLDSATRRGKNFLLLCMFMFGTLIVILSHSPPPDSCARGFYGDARPGSTIGCRQCMCPGGVGSGYQHADTCRLDRNRNQVFCDCFPGFGGQLFFVKSEFYYEVMGRVHPWCIDKIISYDRKTSFKLLSPLPNISVKSPSHQFYLHHNHGIITLQINIVN